MKYKNTTVKQGLAMVLAQLNVSELQSVNSFSDLHDICDANLLVPFSEDCGNVNWLKFANAVTAAFDQFIKQRASADRITYINDPTATGLSNMAKRITETELRHNGFYGCNIDNKKRMFVLCGK